MCVLSVGGRGYDMLEKVQCPSHFSSGSLVLRVLLGGCIGSRYKILIDSSMNATLIAGFY